MAEVAGLAFGVLALWTSCVQVFETIDSTRNYGMDHELLRVKLEVERIRLVNWGNAVGLGDATETSTPDARLEREDIRNAVIRVLGYIQHIFENSEKLQSDYGLKPAVPQAEVSNVTTTSGSFLMGDIFKKSYEILRKNAKGKQKSANLAKRTIWAIHNKKKFQDMVAELRKLNDSLDDLVPGSAAKVVEIMREEVTSSDNVQGLLLLQDATAEDHEDISESASARLDSLGATRTARTDLLSERLEALSVDEDAATLTEDVQQSNADTGPQAQTAEGNQDLGEYHRRIKRMEDYLAKKRDGSLHISVIGPSKYSTRVSARSYWAGMKDPDDPWNNKPESVIKLDHASFGQ